MKTSVKPCKSQYVKHIYVGDRRIAAWDTLFKKVVFWMPDDFRGETNKGSAPTEDIAIALAVEHLNLWLAGLTPGIEPTTIDVSSVRLE